MMRHALVALALCSLAVSPVAAQRRAIGRGPGFSSGLRFGVSTSTPNLLTKTQAFDDAAWTKTSVTATADTTVAPDGTATADSINFSTSGTASRRVNQAYSTTAAGTYTASMFVKPGSYTYAALQLYDDNATVSRFTYVFDLSAGTVVGAFTANAVGGSASIAPAANGFYRLSVTGPVAPAAAISVQVFPKDTNALTSSSTGNAGTASPLVIAWGAQLNTGSSATTYQPVN